MMLARNANSQAITPKVSTKSSGFTLTELLVAITITGILVAGSSVGLQTILQKNADSEKETLRRRDSNRALDFMTEEIKMAQSISEDFTDEALKEALEESKLSSSTVSNQTPILVLTIPNFDDHIVYRIAEPAGSTVWQGPRVVYRWGPGFTSDGNYSNQDDRTKWQNRPLIDFISVEGGNCDSGTQIPDTPEGFYICLQGNRSAEIFLRNSEGNITLRKKGFARSAN